MVMKKYLAEMVGTFVLVFGGCGSAVLAGQQIGFLGVINRLRSYSIGNGLCHRAYFRVPHQSGSHG
jgi:glycerol uptake facilitator-like aquaporin